MRKIDCGRGGQGPQAPAPFPKPSPPTPYRGLGGEIEGRAGEPRSPGPFLKSPPPAPKWLLEEVRRAKRGRSAEIVTQTGNLLNRLHLPTVCESARCPNRGECFSHHTATFLILGDVCTRGCAFCAVKKGMPLPLKKDEPQRLARAVSDLGLRHVVITSVTRDDLPDGGAAHYARVVGALREHCPGVRVELLAPDFAGSREAVATVLAAGPDILAHNLETAPRLYSLVRRSADYRRSLKVLQQAKELSPQIITKSGLMLGLGEEYAEIDEVLKDLRQVDCDMLTLGQYLSPSLHHVPVARYVNPEEFGGWRRHALALGFKSVAAGALVRSSYKASIFFGDLFRKVVVGGGGFGGRAGSTYKNLPGPPPKKYLFILFG
ncbi:MAG: lipoyl synthase [Deltaproteobacteria bacterium]|nr:lipoyl synthase [Deltaproteobacteria bacterium]